MSLLNATLLHLPCWITKLQYIVYYDQWWESASCWKRNAIVFQFTTTTICRQTKQNFKERLRFKNIFRELSSAAAEVVWAQLLSLGLRQSPSSSFRVPGSLTQESTPVTFTTVTALMSITNWDTMSPFMFFKVKLRIDRLAHDQEWFVISNSY